MLRAVAVLTVMLYHFPNVFPPRSVAQLLLRKVAWVGWAGVDLFLVLSGFLIANLLFEEYRVGGKIDLLRFWTRRAFKIYPGFYLLVVLWVTGVFAPESPVTLQTTLGEAFFLQNYLPHFWTHTWSLALEEHFYLLIGLLFVGGLRRACVRRWPWVVVTVVTVCLGLRFWMASTQPFDPETHLYPTHLRIDSLFFGSAIAYLQNFHRAWCRNHVIRFRWALLLMAAVFLSLGFRRGLGNGCFAQTIGLTCLALGFALVVTTIVFGAFSFLPPYGKHGLLVIGQCSYAIYLWHLATLRHIVPKIECYVPFLFGYVELALYIGLGISIGIVMTRRVEEPFLRIRERYFPRRCRGEQGMESGSNR